MTTRRLSFLSYLLQTERQRSPLDKRPLIHERPISADAPPLLVTNTVGNFLLSRRSKEGYGRCAFSRVLLESEGEVFVRAVTTMIRLSVEHKWGNRCKTLPDAFARLQAEHLEPRTLVISYDLAQSICGKEFPDAEGFVTTLSLHTQSSTGLCGPQENLPSINVLVAKLPEQTAVVAPTPALLGFYIRFGDYLGCMFQSVDKRLLVVNLGPP